MLVDQHPLWLDAVEPVLSRIGVEVVGRTTSAAEAVALVQRHRPDALIAETLTVEGVGSVLDAISDALAAHPSVKVIALSTSRDDADVQAAFAAGATVYIVKTTHPDDIASGIRQAFENSVFLPGQRDVGHELRPRPVRGVPAPRDPVHDAGLTRRELEILQLVAHGHSNGQLARMLWVTEQTVKFHLSNIYRKLNVANRTEASRWAHKHNLLEAHGVGAEGDEEPAAMEVELARPRLHLAAARSR